MPKVSKRRVQQNGGSSSGSSRFQSTTANSSTLHETRKVSFEDGPSCPSSPQLQQSTSTTSTCSLPRISCCSNIGTKHKMLTRKATPNVSLTRLVKENNEQSTPLSPVRTTAAAMVDTSPTSSPWGQFVDVVPDDFYDDEEHKSRNKPPATLCNWTSLSPKSSLSLSPPLSLRPSSYEPYPKPQRRPLRRSPTSMSGFMLSIPKEVTTVAKELKKMQM